MLIILSDDEDRPSTSTTKNSLPSTSLPIVAPPLSKRIVDSYQAHDSTSCTQYQLSKLTDTNPIYISSSDDQTGGKPSEDDSSAELVKIVKIDKSRSSKSLKSPKNLKGRPEKPVKSSTSIISSPTIPYSTVNKARRESQATVEASTLHGRGGRSQGGSAASRSRARRRRISEGSAYHEQQPRYNARIVSRRQIRPHDTARTGLQQETGPGSLGPHRRDDWRMQRHGFEGDWHDRHHPNELRSSERNGFEREWHDRHHPNELRSSKRNGFEREWHDRYHPNELRSSEREDLLLAPSSCEREGLSEYDNYRWPEDADQDSSAYGSTGRTVRRGFGWCDSEGGQDDDDVPEGGEQGESALPDDAVWPVPLPLTVDETRPTHHHVRPARRFEEPTMKATDRFLNAFSPPPRRFLCARFMLPVIEPPHVRREMIEAARDTAVITELLVPKNSLTTATINALFGIK